MFIWQQPLQLMVTSIGGNVYKGYLGVGASGAIATSSDGLTYKAATSGVTTNLVDIAYGNGIWMAAAENGKVLRSIDAVTWEAVDVHSSTSGVLCRAVVYAGDRFVVVYRSTAAIHKLWYTKDNGVTWSSYSSTNLTTQYVGNRVLAYKSSTNTVAVAGTNGANYITFLNVSTGAIQTVINGMGDTYYSTPAIISTRNGWLIGGQGAKIAYASEATRVFSRTTYGDQNNNYISGFAYDKTSDRYMAYGNYAGVPGSPLLATTPTNLGTSDPTSWSSVSFGGLPTSSSPIKSVFFIEGQTRPTVLTTTGVFNWNGTTYAKTDSAILEIVRYAQ